jgi:Fe-S cluster biosynthesis and repair protein YggX
VYNAVLLLGEKTMTRMVQCIKLGREAEGLDVPPLPGPLGVKIYNQVSKEAWQAWIRHQTMLINENRLNLADARARQYLAQQIENYFFGEGADHPSGFTPE